MEPTPLTDTEWPYVLTLLPPNYAETARSTGAFQRRRGVDSPATLLRLALSYAADASSLRTVAARAGVQGLATLSDVALLNRLRAAAPWLGRLLTDLLAQQLSLPPAPTAGPQPLRLCLQDATTVSGPGATGAEWRVHLGFDLRTLTLDQVAVTPASGAGTGETLTRVAVAPGEVWVADRGYAQRAGIAHCVATGGHVVVRLNWQNVPLQHPDGTPFALLAALHTLQDGESGDFPVQTAPTATVPAVAGRLVAVRMAPPEAAAARRRVEREARKQGRTPDARTLEAAGYVFLLTTLPVAAFPAATVLAIYRFRWQIEVAFKRGKSLCALGELTAKDPALCRAFLFGKLLLYVLAERLRRTGEAFSPWTSPWGYGLPPPAPRRAGVAAHPGGVGELMPSSRAAADSGPVASARAEVRPPAGRTTTPPTFPSDPSVKWHPCFPEPQPCLN